MSDSGNLNIKNAIGQTGQVYLPIKAMGANTGKVQLAVQGALRELPAITKGDTDLATGTRIRVIAIEGDETLIVEKLT